MVTGMSTILDIDEFREELHKWPRGHIIVAFLVTLRPTGEVFVSTVLLGWPSVRRRPYESSYRTSRRRNGELANHRHTTPYHPDLSEPFEAHPNRGFGSNPHIHLGPVKHLPILLGP